MSRVSRPYWCLPTRAGQLLFMMSIFSVTQVLDTVYSLQCPEGYEYKYIQYPVSSIQCPVSSVQNQSPAFTSLLTTTDCSRRETGHPHCSQLYCTVVNATALQCVFTALQCTIQCTALQWVFTAVQCSASAVKRTTTQCIRLHLSVLLLDSLHCTQILAFGKPFEEKTCFCLDFFQAALTPPPLYFWNPLRNFF